jgi:hypothetical protein
MTGFETMVKNARASWEALHQQKKPCVDARAAS